MSRILVIDDEENWLDLSREFLGEAGHDVVAISDGLKAFEMLEAEPLDLVVLDIKMPLNGRSLLWYASRYRPDLPVVIHSAFASCRGDPDFEDADAFVVKSPDFQELLQTIDKIVETGA